MLLLLLLLLLLCCCCCCVVIRKKWRLDHTACEVCHKEPAWFAPPQDKLSDGTPKPLRCVKCCLPSDVPTDPAYFWSRGGGRRNQRSAKLPDTPLGKPELVMAPTFAVVAAPPLVAPAGNARRLFRPQFPEKDAAFNEPFSAAAELPHFAAAPLPPATLRSTLGFTLDAEEVLVNSRAVPGSAAVAVVAEEAEETIITEYYEFGAELVQGSYYVHEEEDVTQTTLVLTS